MFIVKNLPTHEIRRIDKKYLKRAFEKLLRKLQSNFEKQIPKNQKQNESSPLTSSLL